MRSEKPERPSRGEEKRWTDQRSPGVSLMGEREKGIERSEEAKMSTDITASVLPEYSLIDRMPPQPSLDFVD